MALPSPPPVLVSNMSALSSALTQRPLYEGEIFVMVAVNRTNAEGSSTAEYETLHIFPAETVHDLKLRLAAKKGYYNRGHMVIFGDRELGEHELLAPLAETSGLGSDYLHLFVRISDLESVDVTTNQRSISLGENSVPRDSPLLLEGSMASLGSPPVGSPDASSPEWSHDPFRGSASSACDIIEAPEPRLPPNNFVHVVMRRSANRKLQYVVDGDVFELSVSSSDSTEDVTRKIVEAQGHDVQTPHVLMYNGECLDQAAPMASHGIPAGARLTLAALPAPVPAPGSPPPPGDWMEARRGLEQGYVPKLAAAGSGGSYFMPGPDGSAPVAVFKPEDEEPRARNNPRGLVATPGAEGLRKGVLPGEGASREVAAYLLDHGNFSGVPPTAMVSFMTPAAGADSSDTEVKRGSLQQYVTFDYDCEEQSPSQFTVEQCHRVFVLDLRLANCDRNAGNILARKEDSGWRLTPIDHGYCLPDSFQDISFEWMYWPQADVPFSEETCQYIRSLDAEKDIEILRAHGLTFRPECLRVLRVCTRLLKRGAEQGMTPYDIGRLMSREYLTMSPLEKLHKRARKMAAAAHNKGMKPHNATENPKVYDEDVYLIEMYEGINQLIDELVMEKVEQM
mmetsp:Transcript_42769/g.76730  ORF Transcript_42769/g.76730 Transcript_42769/m.76730 type:complete len:622 (-) Transcript_42769:628-2493(-)